MFWLIVQMWALLAVAALLGGVIVAWVLNSRQDVISEEVEAQIDAARTRLHACEAARSRAESRAQSLVQALAAANDRVKGLEDRVERLLEDAAPASVLRARTAELEQELNAARARLVSETSVARDLRARLEQVEARAGEVQAMRARIAELEELAAEAGRVAELEADAQALRAQAEELEQRIAASESDAYALRTSARESEAAHERAEEDAATLRASARELEAALDRAEDDAAALRAALTAAERAGDEADDDRAALRGQLGALESALDAAEDDAAELRKRARILESSVDEAEVASPNGLHEPIDLMGDDEEDSAREGAGDDDDDGAPRPPTFLEAPVHGDPDDLQRIKGVGPKLAQTLNDLGVFYFAQIARWSDRQVGEVDGQLRFRGRIDRDDWRGQARVLAAMRQGPPIFDAPPASDQSSAN